MQKKNIIKNAVHNAGSWIVIVFIGIIATPYILNKLSIEGYGIYALLTGLMGYYGLFDLGLEQGIIKFVSQYSVQQNNDGISRSINTAIAINMTSGLIGSICLIVLAEQILTLLQVPSIFWEDAKVGLYFSAIAFYLTMLSKLFGAVLMGLQRYDITSKINTVSSLLVTLIIVILLYLGYGLKEVIFAHLIISAIVFVTYGLLVHYLLPNWKISILINVEQLRKMLSFSGYVFCSRMVTIFDTFIVRFFIGALLGTAAVTYYVVPIKIIAVFSGLLGTVTTIFLPVASGLASSEDKDKIHIYYIKASKYVLGIAMPSYLFLIVFSREILNIWIGKEFAISSWLIMTIASIAYFLSAMTMIPTNFVFGLGKSKPIAVFSLIGLILKATLIFPMVHLWGITGPAIAIFLSQLSVLIAIPYYTSKVMKLPFREYARKIFKGHSITLIIFIVTISLFRSYLSFAGIFQFVFFTIVFFGMYFAILFILNPQWRKEIEADILGTR